KSAIGTAFPKDDIRHLAEATSVRARRHQRHRHRIEQHFPSSNPHSTTPLLTVISTPAVSSLGSCPTPATHTAATQRPTLARAGVRQSLPTSVGRRRPVTGRSGDTSTSSEKAAHSTALPSRALHVHPCSSDWLPTA